MENAGKIALGMGVVLGVIALIWAKKSSPIPPASTPASPSLPPLNVNASGYVPINLLLTNGNSGQSFAIQPGDTITIHLAGLSTKGNTWKLSGSGDVHVFVLDSGPTDDVAGNQVVYQAHSAAPGQAVIQLDAIKPASLGGGVLKTIQYHFVSGAQEAV